MSVPLILFTLIYAVTSETLKEGRDIAIVPIVTGGSPAAAGNLILGDLGGSNGNVPILRLDANGGLSSFSGVSQAAGNGIALLEDPVSSESPEFIDCPCGCNVTIVKGLVRPAILQKDTRCSRVSTVQIVNVQNGGRVDIQSPTATIGKHPVICPCGCFISTPKNTNLTIFVDEVNCRRDPAGSVDGIPNNCSCGCEGQSPQGTIYKFGRAPSCNEIPSVAGGSTVILNNAPDLNAAPLGLFPFTNIRNAPFGSGFGFGGFPGGFGGLPGGVGGVRTFRRRR